MPSRKRKWTGGSAFGPGHSVVHGPTGPSSFEPVTRPPPAQDCDPEPCPQPFAVAPCCALSARSWRPRGQAWAGQRLVTARPCPSSVGSVVFRLRMQVPGGTPSVASVCAQVETPVRPWSIQGLGCVDTAPGVGSATLAHEACHLLEDTEVRIELALLFYRMCSMA